MIERKRLMFVLIAASILWFSSSARSGEFAGEVRRDQEVQSQKNALVDAEKTLGPEAPPVIHILAQLAELYTATGNDAALAAVGRRLAEVKKKNYEAWLTLGRIFSYTENYPEAEIATKNALMINPDDWDATVQLGYIYNGQGRFQHAARRFEDALEKRPQSFTLYAALAQTYVNMGRYEQAKKTFSRAKKVKGAEESAYIMEGYDHFKHGEDTEAEENFKSVIAKDTANPEGYHHMGSYLAQNRRYSEAEEYFRQALRLLNSGPRFRAQDVVHTRMWLGDVLFNQGKMAEAEAVYRAGLGETSFDTTQQIQLLINLSSVCVSQGRDVEAEGLLKQGVDLCKLEFSCSRYNHGRALAALAAFYADQGKITESKKMTDAAWKMNLHEGLPPAHLDSLLRFAALHVRLGENDKGEKLYRMAVAARQSQPLDAEKIEAEKGLADLLRSEGRLSEAEKLYLMSIKSLGLRRWREDKASALEGLAAVYEKQGKHQQADEAKVQAQTLRMQP